MEEAPLRLFGMWASPFVHRVQLALHLKGVEYEFVEEDLSNKSPSLLHYNPVHKKIPVLLHGDRAVAESMVILEYVDEAWKGGRRQLLPEDPYDRAVVRFWCHFVEDKLRPSFSAVLRSSSSESQKEAMEEFHRNLSLLEDELRDGSFKGKTLFGGENMGLLDIVTGCGLHWITMYEEMTGTKVVDKESFPFFTSWFENFEKTEEVQAVIPPTAKLIQYAKDIYQKMKM